MQSSVIVTANLKFPSKENLGPQSIHNLTAKAHDMSTTTTV